MNSLGLENNSETWWVIFQSIRETDTNYSNFLEELNQQMTLFLKKKSMSSKIQDKSDFFIKEIIPQVLRKFSRFRNSNLSSTTQKKLCLVFQTAVNFIDYALEENAEFLFNPIINFMNPKSNLYKKCITEKSFYSLYFCYFSNNDKINEYFNNNIGSDKITISQFKFVFQIFAGLKAEPKFESIIKKFTKDLGKIFLIFLENLPISNNLETHQTSIFLFIDILAFDLNIDIYEVLLQILIKYMKSDENIKNVLSAKSLSKFFTTIPNSLKIFDFINIKNLISDFMDYITAESSERQGIVTLLLPFFESIKLNPLFKFNHVFRLFQMSIYLPEYDRGIIFDFIVNCLNIFEPDSFFFFLDLVTDFPMEETGFLFLRKIPNDIWEKNYPLSEHWITILTKQLHNNIAKNTIISLSNRTKLNDTIKKKIIDSLIVLLKEDDENMNKFIKKVFLAIISSSSNLAFLFTNASKIIKATNSQNRKYIFKILSILKNKIPETITISHINISNFFNNTPKDAILWNFFRKLFDSKKFSKYSQEFETITKIAEQVAKGQEPSTITREFIDLLKSIIIFMNWPECDNYFYSKCPLRFIDLLFDSYIASNSDSMRYIEEVSADLTNNYKIPIHKILKKWLTMNSLLKDNQLKILFFIKNFINLTETINDPEDFGSPRHRYPKSFILIKCIENESSKCDVHISPSSSLKTLLQRIGNRLNLETIYAKEFSNDNDLNKSLKSLGISGSSDFLFSSKTIPKKNRFQPLSLKLGKYNFVKQLLDISKNQISDDFLQTIEDILNLLPTDYANSYSLNQLNMILTENCNNFTCKKYSIESIINSLKTRKDDKNEFHNLAQLNVIINSYEHYKDPIFFELFYTLFKTELISSIPIYYLKSIFDCISSKNDSIFVYKCLNAISKKYSTQELVSTIKNNQEIFSNALDNISPPFWNKAFVFFNHINGNFLFELVRERITENQQNLPFIFRILYASFEKDSDLTNITSIFSRILKSLKWKNIKDSLYYATYIIYKFCKSDSNLKKQVHLYIDDLIKYTFDFYNDDGKTQTMIIQLIELIMNEKLKEKIEQILVFFETFERWDFDPAMLKRNLPYTGLRNLGSTCFFNSVIQQLFYIPQFLNIMMLYNFDDNSVMKLLQNLFIQMKYTERKFCDPEPFINSWDGWITGKLNPHEQQDAIEFFDILLDKLPNEMNKIFTGEFTNTLKLKNGDFFYRNTEPFKTLGVTINTEKSKDFNGKVEKVNIFKKSLKKIIANEELSTIDDKMNKKIVVDKTTKISNLPQILVIHLKRFEYSLKSNERIKINDEFEFPLHEIDLKFLMNKKSNRIPDSSKYTLNGIIVHSGTAIGGHYTSIIKINGKWVKFNDIEVEEILTEEVQHFCFGKNNMSSAYALFYINNNSLLKNSEYLNEKPKQNDMCEIINDNIKFKESQLMFSLPIINYIQKQRDINLKLTFFINIMCHSRLEDECNKFSNELCEAIRKENLEEGCLAFLTNKVEDIYNNFLNCQRDNIINSLKKLIFTCSSKDVSICSKLIQYSKRNVYSFLQVPKIFKLVFSIMKNNPRQAIENNLFEYITDLILLAYQKPKMNLIDQLNFKYLFKCLKKMLKEDNKINIPSLKDYEAYIIKSSYHKEEYEKLKHCLESFVKPTPYFAKTERVSSFHELIPKNQNQVSKKDPIYTSTKKNQSNSLMQNRNSKSIPKQESFRISDFIDKLCQTITQSKNIEEFLEKNSNLLKMKNLETEEIRSLLNSKFDNHFGLWDKAVKQSPNAFFNFLCGKDFSFRTFIYYFYCELINILSNRNKKDLLKNLYNNFSEYIHKDRFSKIFKEMALSEEEITKKNAQLYRYLQIFKKLLEKNKDFDNENISNKIFDYICAIQSSPRKKKNIHLKILFKIYSVFDDSIKKNKFDKIFDMVKNLEPKVYIFTLVPFLTCKNIKYQLFLELEPFDLYIKKANSCCPAATITFFQILKNADPSSSNKFELSKFLNQTNAKIGNNNSIAQEFKEAYAELKEKQHSKVSSIKISYYINCFFQLFENKSISSISTNMLIDFSVEIERHKSVKMYYISFNPKILAQKISAEAPFRSPLIKVIQQVITNSNNHDLLEDLIREIIYTSDLSKIQQGFLNTIMNFIKQHQKLIKNIINKDFFKENCPKQREAILDHLLKWIENKELDLQTIGWVNNHICNNAHVFLKEKEQLYSLFLNKVLKLYEDEMIIDIFLQLQNDLQNNLPVIDFLITNLYENKKTELINQLKELSKISKNDLIAFRTDVRNSKLNLIMNEKGISSPIYVE